VRYAYAFNSEMDVVLSAGTRTAGTVDGIRTDGRGASDTKCPMALMPAICKARTVRYQEGWMRYDDIGDHIAR